MGPIKKTIVGLLVFNPLWSVVLSFTLAANKNQGSPDSIAKLARAKPWDSTYGFWVLTLYIRLGNLAASVAD